MYTSSCTISLIQVLLLVSVSSQHLNIIPNNFTGICSYYQNETCLTLPELVSNASRLDQANLTLNFLPGDHVLAHRVAVNYSTNLVFTGDICNASQCETKISCRGTSGFDFQNVNSINITGIQFSGCGGVEINGGAINVNNATYLSIRNCHFIGNKVFGERVLGGAVYIDTAFDVSVHDSYFFNNSAHCNDNGQQSCDSALNIIIGGAIFIADNTVVISSCHFEQNGAYSAGGAIASIVTTLVVVHSTFVNNQVYSDTAGFGGAIYAADKVNLTISSSQYTNNAAKVNGGAVSVSQSLLYISDSHFTNNTAHIAGGAVEANGESSLTSSDTYFTNNYATQYGGAVYIIQSWLAETACFYSNNIANVGGALYAEDTSITSNNSWYKLNEAALYGGAISSYRTSSKTVEATKLDILGSRFSSNEAKRGGGIIAFALDSVSVSESNFETNHAIAGGAIYIQQSPSFCTCNNFTNNTADLGGAIYVMRTSMSIKSSFHKSNRAFQVGGAMCIKEGNISTSDSYYTNNRALAGGAIYINGSSFASSSRDTYSYNSADSFGGVISGNTSSINDFNNTYSNNSAHSGGVIYVEYSNIFSVGSYHKMNWATVHGGAISILKGNVSISDSCFANNRALDSGGSINVDTGNLSISGGYYSGNEAGYGSVVYIQNGSVSTTSGLYSNNIADYGSVIYTQNGSVNTTSCLFSNNKATLAGGVMYAETSSTINSVDCNYTSNIAPLGGVFFIVQSFLRTSQSFYRHNTATQSGGAVFCRCFEQSHACSIYSIGSYYTRNNASSGGGAILATASCNVLDTDNYYSYNNAQLGGAMNLQRGTISISGTRFSNNNAHSGGGAMYTRHYLLSISDTQFTSNTANGGGALYCSNTSLSVLNSTYTSNSAQEGGALYCYNTSLSMLDSKYASNQAQDGGAILMSDGPLTCLSSYFVSNDAISNGGAIAAQRGNFASTDCHFKNNQAKNGGAIQVDGGNVSSVNSSYSYNDASEGTIHVNTGSLSISGSNYTGNLGGAIYISNEGSIFSTDSCYVNNTGNSGGAMYINKGSISCVNSSFKYNRAQYCGAIFAWTNTVVTSSSCLYESNEGSLYGGAICSYRGAITSSDTNYTNNYSDLGGAVFVFGGNMSVMDSNFQNNKAHNAGGAICALLSNIYSDNNYYRDNSADEYGGAIYTDSCMHTESISLFHSDTEGKLSLASAESICTENKYLDRPPDFDSAKTDFFGSTIFTSNTCGNAGGAIISIQVEVFFNGKVVEINNNTATFGGGLALVGSSLNIQSPVEIHDNKAILSGGGIFSYLSYSIRLHSQEKTNINGNTASHNGGGVYAIDSNIEITYGILHFGKNIATKGAAVSLEQNSKIHLLKQTQETMGEYDIKLEFIENHAQFGGALYVADSSEDTLACERRDPGSGEAHAQLSQECFIQTNLLNTTWSEDNTEKNYINVFFINNTANVSGGAIYGGLLDRCSLNSSAELVTQFPEFRESTGFDYIRAAAQFSGLVDYVNLTLNYNPDKFINTITSSKVRGLISSEAVQVCFCLDGMLNCSYDHPTVFTKKGQLFRLNVAAVDQVGNPINATVISSFVSNNADLNVDQARQITGTQCTELEYNVYPKGKLISKSAQIEVYADGPCTDHGISKRMLNVTFSPCACPIGFQPVETVTLCRCDCDPILRPEYIVNCSYTDQTVLRDSNAWIDYVNTTTEAGYLIYPNCPFDYCVDKPVNINLNIPNGADVQCAFNRSGKLCGFCNNNLSLVIGSSRCQQCTNNYISLIIPFAVAGIALVAFILILNVTVATGTIHGLIFYANILVASRSIFIPFHTPNVLHIFISWINLDLGIETCFYNGMDSFAKVLLQLAFPTYIILITITIIIISEYSIWFSTLIGKKDPVATLCTLILLSYSKLIRIIIASLQYTYLNYPDGSREMVWLYDANVPYISTSRIPLFIISIVIIVLGSVYTMLIFFGQWIPRCGNRMCFNNPKYNAFIVKYHAPFNPKHRYWVGLLLLARIFHYLVASFVPDTAILLSVSCIVVGLVILKLLNTTRIYNNWLLDTLDIVFLANLVIFAVAVYYVRESEGNKIVLAAISLGISFITFLGILTYHFYAYILKDTQCWGKTMQLLQRIAHICNKRNNIEYERVPVPLEEDSESDDGDEQMIELQPPYTDDNDTDPIDLPHYYDPPAIVPAVRYDQLREPALDIIDPITTDDYRQLNQPPAPRPRQLPTSTIVDFVRPSRNADFRDHP